MKSIEISDEAYRRLSLCRYRWNLSFGSIICFLFDQDLSLMRTLQDGTASTPIICEKCHKLHFPETKGQLKVPEHIEGIET